MWLFARVDVIRHKAIIGATLAHAFPDDKLAKSRPTLRTRVQWSAFDPNSALVGSPFNQPGTA